eukprot:CAMPEP_0171274206 /NCGR_PEP_ID=MMETSP0790-20130122/62693_1 /TAXON_ID=2925 /ORGANISM="Alexandrium catenella, Strain OF101" /LENGTH=47 /DNA_ID= /DNA_START= /DNA_END= /DNA_ORIENTATION=
MKLRPTIFNALGFSFSATLSAATRGATSPRARSKSCHVHAQKRAVGG